MKKYKFYNVAVSGNENFPYGGNFYKGTKEQIAKKLVENYLIDKGDEEQLFENVLKGTNYKGIKVYAPDDVEAFAITEKDHSKNEMARAILDDFGGGEPEDEYKSGGMLNKKFTFKELFTK